MNVQNYIFYILNTYIVFMQQYLYAQIRNI